MSTTFSVTRDDIINRALRICGAYDASNPPNTTDFTTVSTALNIMIKAWVRAGIPMWQIVTVTLPLLSGQNTYQIGPFATGTGALVTTRILKVPYAVLRRTIGGVPNDIPIDQLSIQEYEQFGAKQALGVVIGMLYRAINDSTTNSSYIQVYPTPSDNTQSLRMQCFVTIDDVNAGTDPLDFPQETYMALCWNLADEISMEYAVPMDRVKEIKVRANKTFEDMKDWSQENAESIRLMYDTRGGVSHG